MLYFDPRRVSVMVLEAQLAQEKHAVGQDRVGVWCSFLPGLLSSDPVTVVAHQQVGIAPNGALGEVSTKQLGVVHAERHQTPARQTR